MTNYELPRHIWDMIKEQVSESEVMEVKNIIGESLVDQTIELRQEVLLLMEIWNDVRQKQLISNRLPEPQSIRDLLVKDIKIFADNIREKIMEDRSYSRSIDEVLGNDRVLDYVFSDTVSSGNSRQSSARSTSSSSSRAGPSAEDLNGLGLLRTPHLDEVLERTRDLLKFEVDQLEEDICYIQECLENDSHMGTVPSITDLKRTRSRLDIVSRQLSSSSSSFNRTTPPDNQSLRQFLLEYDDLFINEPVTAEEDDGFRSPPSSSSSSSSSSSFQAPITLHPHVSFPSHSLQLPPATPPYPPSNSGSGQDLVTSTRSEFVQISNLPDLSTNNEDQGRMGGGDDEDDVGDNLVTSSDSSHASTSSSILASSSSSSGIFSQSQAPSSSSSSSSSLGKVSSLQKRMDLLLSYRK